MADLKINTLQASLWVKAVQTELADTKATLKEVQEIRNKMMILTIYGMCIITSYNTIDKIMQMIDGKFEIYEKISTYISQEINKKNDNTLKDRKSSLMIELLENTPQLTEENIRDLINSNQNLSDKDKNIMLNSGIIKLASKYSNENKEYAVQLYNNILPNLKIKYEYIDEIICGLWLYNECTILINTKLIEQQENSERLYKQVLIHEFSHLFQPPNNYYFLLEGCAYIMDKEFQTYLESEDFLIFYYDYSICKNPKTKYLAILMECIGIEPVIRYNFTGSIEPIKQELEKYLSVEDINILLDKFKQTESLIGKTITIEDWNQNINDIDKIYRKLYFAKYNKEIETNQIINSYFNPEMEETKKFYFNSICNDLFISHFEKQNIWQYCLSKKQIDSKKIFDILDYSYLKHLFELNANLSDREKQLLFNKELIFDFINYNKIFYSNKLNQNILNQNIFNVEHIQNEYLENLKITKVIPEYNCSEKKYNNSIISVTNFNNNEIVIDEKSCYLYSVENELLYEDVYKKEIVEQFIKSFNQNSNINDNILNNGCTRIILKEYYGIQLQQNRKNELDEKVVKILIDIIGNDALKMYYFTGDDSLIRDKLSQYLEIDMLDSFMLFLKSEVVIEDDIYYYEQSCNWYISYLDSKINNNYSYHDNFIDNYYIPKDKIYFNNNCIKKNKQSYSENYTDTFNKKNILSKRR